MSRSILELKHEIEQLKRKCDLVALVEKAGVELTKHGNEYRGKCPLHSGNNPTAFVIKTGSQGQYYTCYAGCGSGDVIDFVMKMFHLDFKEALTRLGVMDLPKPDAAPPVAKKENGPPPHFWQVRAWRVIERAEVVLWSEDGETARRYLHQRGLTDETIRLWRLGLIPNNCYDSPKVWGLDGKKIWLPRGIVIPCIHGETVWYLNIRRPEGLPKYYKVRGGQHAIFGVTELYHPTIIFTEGEFDAMLLHQEVGDLADVATAGAVKFLPHGNQLTLLLAKLKIWAVVDTDPEGLKAIAKWQSFSQRVKVIRPLQGKDVTEFFQAGGNLRAWIRYHLANEQPTVTSAPAHPAHPLPERRITLPVYEMLDYLTENKLKIVSVDWSTYPPTVHYDEAK